MYIHVILRSDGRTDSTLTGSQRWFLRYMVCQSAPRRADSGQTGHYEHSLHIAIHAQGTWKCMHSPSRDCDIKLISPCIVCFLKNSYIP
jgi:hypothetical protein